MIGLASAATSYTDDTVDDELTGSSQAMLISSLLVFLLSALCTAWLIVLALLDLTLLNRFQGPALRSLEQSDEDEDDLLPVVPGATRTSSGSEASDSEPEVTGRPKQPDSLREHVQFASRTSA